MSDYISRLSELVARNKPPLHSGSGAGGGGVFIPQGGFQQAPGPLESAGAGLLKGMAERIDFMTNPERVGERAQKTWEMIVGMPDELREQVLRRPEVQKRLDQYAKARPEMFFKDKGLGGMWNAVDSKSLKLAESMAKSEQKLTEAQTGKTRADTRQTEVETEQTLAMEQTKKDMMVAQLNAQLIENEKGEIDLKTMEKMRNLDMEDLKARIGLIKAQKGLYSAQTQELIDKLPEELKQLALKTKMTEEQIKKLSAETDLTRANTRAVSGEETRARSLHPDQLKYVKAQIENLQADAAHRRAQALEGGRRDDSKAIDQMLKAKGQIFDKHKDEILYRGDAVPYAIDLTNEVDSWARGLGVEELEYGKETYHIPRAMKHDYLRKEIIYTVNEAFTAFKNQLTMLKQQPDKLEQLVDSVTSMYSQTFASPMISDQAMNFLVLPNTQADLYRKIATMQLVLDDVKPYLSKEDRQAIMDAVGDYAPEEVDSGGGGLLGFLGTVLTGGSR